MSRQEKINVLSSIAAHPVRSFLKSNLARAHALDGDVCICKAETPREGEERVILTRQGYELLLEDPDYRIKTLTRFFGIYDIRPEEQGLVEALVGKREIIACLGAQQQAVRYRLSLPVLQELYVAGHLPERKATVVSPVLLSLAP